MSTTHWHCECGEEISVCNKCGTGYNVPSEEIRKLIDECEAALHFYANYEPCAGNQYLADKAEQSIRKWREGKP